ncbi:galactosylceramide sulfotransferase-like [Oculina patagonica]
MVLATCITCLVFMVYFSYEFKYLWKIQRHPTISKEQLETAANTIKSAISTNQEATVRKCSPTQQVLFLKTHKTGSTTIANIFFRYGDSRDLSFVLGQDTLIGWPRRFQVSFALPFDGPQPNFLCSHTRYNQKPMNYLFPKTNSKYVTILRNPVDQFESIFNYMGLGDIYGFGRDPRRSLQEFLATGIEFEDVFEKEATRLVRNPMLFDLGLGFKFHQNATAVKEYIAFLDKEFDLIMITDYFDESVVLLKRLLCWELDDVLYFKSNERQDKERAVDLSEEVKENIKRWNAADQLLFDFFNQTFWYKIKMEGEGFYDDLAAFRQKKEQIRRLCLSNGTSLQLQYGHKYVKGVSLKQNLNAKTREHCEKMTRSENSYLTYLRRKRSMRLAALSAAAANERNEEMTSWDVASDLKYTPILQSDVKVDLKRKMRAKRARYQRYNHGKVWPRSGTRRNRK